MDHILKNMAYQVQSLRDYEANDEYVADSIEGGYAFEDIYKLPVRLFQALQGPRNDFPPHVREVLKENGGAHIIDLEVCRKPIPNTIRQFANLISLGKLHRNIGHDDLFHLYLIIFLDNGKVFRIEKDHVIKMEEYNAGPCGMHVSLLRPDQTLGEFINNAVEKGGDGFYEYDVRSHNCQNFINSLLSANGLMTSDLASYILQDVEAILRDTPDISKKIVDIITGIASRADIVLHGKSIMKKYKSMVKKPKKKLKGGAKKKNTSVQSVIFFIKDGWTEDKAKDWLHDHGFSHSFGVDKKVTGELRYRQQSPQNFNTFRTHPLPKIGVDLVFGYRD